MSRRVKIPRKTAGYGYVGMWGDGSIGYLLCDFLSGFGRKYPDPPSHQWNSLLDDGSKERVFLCRIKVTPMRDKLGRPLTRIIGKKEKTSHDP